MAGTSTMHVRMQRELRMLTREPPHGICAWPKDGEMNVIEAQIKGPEDTPFEGGVWKLNVSVPERYPFEPPKVQFVTPIYHPNIDSGGRICLDTLKMPPKGSWRPSVNLSTLLTTIRLLIAKPNADDGLMPDITNLYKTNPRKFAETARRLTKLHAKPKIAEPASEVSQHVSATSAVPPRPVEIVNTTANSQSTPSSRASAQESKEESEEESEESEEEWDESEEEEAESEEELQEDGSSEAPPAKRKKLNTT